MILHGESGWGGAAGQDNDAVTVPLFKHAHPPLPLQANSPNISEINDPSVLLRSLSA